MFCPKCGNSVPDNAKFCSGCGTSVVQQLVPVQVVQGPAAAPQLAMKNTAKQRSSGKLIVFGIVAFCIALVVILNQIGNRQDEAAHQAWLDHQKELNQALVKKQAEQFAAMSSAQHLQSARQLITPIAPESSLAEARRHLDAIPANDPLHQEVEKEREHISNVEKQIAVGQLSQARKLIFKEQYSQARDVLVALMNSNAAPQEVKTQAATLLRPLPAKILTQQKKEQAAAIVASRKAFANELQQEMLKENYDMTINATGKENTTLNIKYVLINRPFVYNFVNNSAVIARMKSLGFTKLILSDGYESTWTYDVAKLFNPS